ncbi:hypothetical protein TNCV_1686861 [Trichonephila clavipes]|nr:hypothetical protein TNCV_1686861 [Trichonephila clavipes]
MAFQAEEFIDVVVGPAIFVVIRRFEWSKKRQITSGFLSSSGMLTNSMGHVDQHVLRNSDKANGSSFSTIPPNRHHDDSELGGKGGALTCVIGVKKLGDCSLLRLFNLPTLLL